MDGGEVDSVSHPDGRLPRSEPEVVREWRPLVQLLSAALPPRTLAGAGGSGTTGGQPVLRDQVPAVALELLCVSAQSPLLSRAQRDSRRPPFPGSPGRRSIP